ncbi:MAG: ROK family protein [Acidimicrobiales bacterium]
MGKSEASTSNTVMAVDVGATTIKFGVVDESGRLVDEVIRLATPYPCTPERLVEIITTQIAKSGCHRVGLGFPGDVDNGRVVEPGNLSRSGGFTSEVDPTLEELWRNIDLQQKFREASQRDVRMVNDAALAALGCSQGAGRELVFTLGTGFGIALVVDGSLCRIRDVGGELFVQGKTYDQLLGEFARSQSERNWNELLVQAVNNFVDEFFADVVHLCGGNSRRVDLRNFGTPAYRIVLNENDVTLRGAVKLFDWKS